MKLFCNWCSEEIKLNGIIIDGLAYHHKCYDEKKLSDHNAVYEAARTEFPGLFDLVRRPEELTDRNILEAARKYPWAMVYRNDFHDLDIDGYSKKVDLMSALGSWAEDVIEDIGIEMDIICILHHKKVWWTPGGGEPLTLTVQFDGT